MKSGTPEGGARGWPRSQQPIPPRSLPFPTSSHRDLSDGFRRTSVSRVSPRWCRLRWPVGEPGPFEFRAERHAPGSNPTSLGDPRWPGATPGLLFPRTSGRGGHPEINRHEIELQVRVRQEQETALEGPTLETAGTRPSLRAEPNCSCQPCGGQHRHPSL